METNRSNSNVKLCKNECGTLIVCNTSQNAFFEIDTNYPHRCPNWRPNRENISNIPNRTITLEQQLYIDTIGPAIVKILSLVQEIHQQTVRDGTRKDG